MQEELKPFGKRGKQFHPKQSERPHRPDQLYKVGLSSDQRT